MGLVHKPGDNTFKNAAGSIIQKFKLFRRTGTKWYRDNEYLMILQCFVFRKTALAINM